MNASQWKQLALDSPKGFNVLGFFLVFFNKQEEFSVPPQLILVTFDNRSLQILWRKVYVLT